MIITRSPLRISLGGGGTDLPSYYRKHGGFLIAAAIDKYIYITVHRRFVDGFLGEQFALPVAVESVRGMRGLPLSGDTVTLSAADPLNLVGILVPGERVPAISGRAVSYRDGIAVTASVAITRRAGARHRRPVLLVPTNRPSSAVTDATIEAPRL